MTIPYKLHLKQGYWSETMKRLRGSRSHSSFDHWHNDSHSFHVALNSLKKNIQTKLLIVYTRGLILKPQMPVEGFHLASGGLGGGKVRLYCNLEMPHPSC